MTRQSQIKMEIQYERNCSGRKIVGNVNIKMKNEIVGGWHGQVRLSVSNL